MRTRLAGLLLCAAWLAGARSACAAPGLKATSAAVCDVDAEVCEADLHLFRDAAALRFVTVIEGATGEAWVEHVWKRDGRVVFRLKLPVRPHRYRTASRKSVAGLPGAWTAVVLDPVGRVLASVAFEVGEPARRAARASSAP